MALESYFGFTDALSTQSSNDDDANADDDDEAEAFGNRNDWH